MAVLGEGIAAVLRAGAFRHVHEVGPVVVDLGIYRRQFALGHGDAERVGEHRFPGRGGAAFFGWVDIVVPFGDESAAFDQGAAVATVCNALVEPGFGRVEAVWVDAGCFGGGGVPGRGGEGRGGHGTLRWLS